MDKEEEKRCEMKPQNKEDLVENKGLLDFLVKAQSAVQNEEEINSEAVDILKSWIIEEKIKVNDKITEQAGEKEK